MCSLPSAIYSWAAVEIYYLEGMRCRWCNKRLPDKFTARLKDMIELAIDYSDRHPTLPGRMVIWETDRYIQEVLCDYHEELRMLERFGPRPAPHPEWTGDVDWADFKQRVRRHATSFLIQKLVDDGDSNSFFDKIRRTFRKQGPNCELLPTFSGLIENLRYLGAG